MDRVQFIEHKGKKLLHLDFAACNPEQTMQIIEKAKTVIAQQPHVSVYTLTDVSNIRFNTDTTEAMKKFAAHNKPFVRAGAVVGIGGMNRVIFNAVMRFSGRHLHACASLDEAKEWLANQ